MRSIRERFVCQNNILNPDCVAIANILGIYTKRKLSAGRHKYHLINTASYGCWSSDVWTVVWIKSCPKFWRSFLTQIPSAAFELPPLPPIHISLLFLHSLRSLVFKFHFYFRTCTCGGAFPPRSHTFQFNSPSSAPSEASCHHLWTDLLLPRATNEKASSKKGYNDENRNMIMPATWAAR